MQYSVTTCKREESGKEGICLHVYVNHSAVHLKLIQHGKPTLLQ